ncbi:helix-turn-helix domain-containing protein [Paenibacillus sp. FSL R7-0345]|uniref:MarR family transcriptional regulator n=1 Tax=Paenibacillus sp. FSL R7-0345 TaxID=2954535 RepID=UPI003159E5E9
MNSERMKILDFMIAINKLDGLYYSIAKQIGVHENEFVLLYALSDGKPHSQRQICDDWQVPRTTINSVTKKFVKLGYIDLVPTGHKEKELFITESGNAYLTAIFSDLFQKEANAFKHTLEPCADIVTEAISQFVLSLENSLKNINGESKHE